MLAGLYYTVLTTTDRTWAGLYYGVVDCLLTVCMQDCTTLLTPHHCVPY
jgi:hypothetical protein